jgi:hypothetical protein
MLIPQWFMFEVYGRVLNSATKRLGDAADQPSAPT